MIEEFEDIQEYLSNKVKVDALIKELEDIERKIEIIRNMTLGISTQGAQKEYEYNINQEINLKGGIKQ